MSTSPLKGGKGGGVRLLFLLFPLTFRSRRAIISAVIFFGLCKRSFPTWTESVKKQKNQRFASGRGASALLEFFPTRPVTSCAICSAFPSLRCWKREPTPPDFWESFLHFCSSPMRRDSSSRDSSATRSTRATWCSSGFLQPGSRTSFFPSRIGPGFKPPALWSWDLRFPCCAGRSPK